MRGEGRRHDPFVVGFMQSLVDQRMMQPAMDPVYAEIGE